MYEGEKFGDITLESKQAEYDAKHGRKLDCDNLDFSEEVTEDNDLAQIKVENCKNFISLYVSL